MLKSCSSWTKFFWWCRSKKFGNLCAMTTMLQFPKPKAKLLPIIGWLASNNRYESNKSCSAPVACSAWNF